MDDWKQDPDVVAQATSGIPTAVFTWVRAIQSGDVWGAWTGMDDDFRLTLAQIVVDTFNPESSLSADSLASRDRLTDEWREIMPTPVLTVLGEMISLIAGREFGGASFPRLVGPDLELFPLVPLDELPKDEDGVAFLAPGADAPSVGVIVRMTPEGKWLIAGTMHAMPRPGSPASFAPFD